MKKKKDGGLGHHERTRGRERYENNRNFIAKECEITNLPCILLPFFPTTGNIVNKMYL